ncbi:Restriction endonuclease XhoI [Lentzea flava]|nr:Restriction endonuclease XhoI [Lentzea flava]
MLAFWAQKDKQQQDAKRTQGGTRDSVTGGRHLNALQDLLLGEFVAAGFPASMIFTSTAKRVLPGWFRPTKSWDLAVIHGDHIVGLVELKSQVGSLGNNANNRAEEAIGNAIDVRYACKNKLLGPTQPWLAYVFVTEDEPSIHEASSRRTNSHYPQRSLFTPREPGGISYVERLAIMGRELVREDLYQAVWIMITADPRKRQFSYRDVADEVGHRNFRLAVRKFSAGLGYKAGVNGDLILGQGDQASLFA